MGSVKILAVDDDLDNLIALRAIITRAFNDITFLEAQSGSGNIESGLLEKPGIILIDLSVLKKEGFRFFQILKSETETKNIPVAILISGNNTNEDKRKALQLGADAFLSKPVDELEVAVQLRAMLRIRELEDRTRVLQAELEEKRKAEIALRESEERFQMLFNKAPLGYQSLDFDGNFIEVNQQWVETLGYSRQEVIGKWFGDFLSPKYRDAFRERFPLFKALGQIHSEFEMVHKDGTILFISFEGKIGRNLNGDFVQTHCILQDITEQRKAQAELKESEEKYRRMVDLLPDAIIIHLDGKIVFANDAAYRLTGATLPNQLLGKPAIEFVHPDDRVKAIDRIKKMYETGEPSGFTEERFVTLNHEIMDAEVIGIPINYKGKSAIQTIVRDITERKRAKIALQEQKNEFETIFNLVPAQIWYKDTHNKIIRVNQQVCRDIGLQCSDLEGRATEELFPEFAGQFYADDLEVIRSGKPKFGIIEKINTASGEIKWHHTNKVPVFSETGEVKGVIAFALDVTKSKQAEDALRANRERWQNLFNNSPSAIAIYQAVDGGNDFVFTDFNLAAQKIDHIRREDVIGKRISELFPGANELGFLDIFRRVWKTGKTEHIGTSYYKDSRVEGWRENIIYRLNTGEIVAIYSDVSDRMEVEIALRESEQRYRQLVENSPIPVVVVSREKGEILFVNQSTYNLVGDLPEGKSIQDFFTTDFYLYPDQRKKLLETLEKSGSVSDMEINLRTFSGNEITVTSSARFTTFEDKPVIFISFYDITDRKRAENVLKERNTFIQTVLDNLPIGLALNSINEGTALYMNKKFEEIYGWPSEEIKDVVEFFGKVYPDENYRNELIARVIADIQSGDASRMHWENCLITHKDGSKHYVNAVNIPLLDQDTMVSTVTDVTEVKLAEQALRQSEEKFRSLFENHSAIKLLIDPESGVIVDANESAARYYGWSREELKQMNIQQINALPPEQVFNAIQHAKNQLQTNFEFQHRLKDGTLRDVEVFNSKIEIGDKVYLHSIIHDSTERKKAERELARNNSRLELAMDSANMAWWEMDVQNGSVVFEKRKAEMLGYLPEKFKHFTDFTNLIHPEDFGKAMDAMRRHLNGEIDKYEVEYRIKSSDGLYRWYYDIGSVIKRDQEGHPLTITGLVLNITGRKQAELALRESQDRYRSFISQVSEGVYRFESNMPVDINLPVEEQIDLLYDHFYLAECNKAFLNMYKISDEKELIGRRLPEFHGGRNNPTNRETLRIFVRNGYRIENALTEELNETGQQIFISNNSLGILEGNRLVRLWGTQTDITEKVKAELVQQVLYSISNAALSSIDLPELIEFISREIGKLLDATNFYIAFYDEETDKLSTLYERDQNDDLQSWPAEGSITGYVVKKQKSILIKDLEMQKFFEDEGIQILGTPAKVWLGVPLTINNKAIGAVVVQSYDNPDAYSEKDRLMLEFISTQISISIERKKAEHELNQALYKAQESDRLKSAFLANMSHEIRTPLNSIIGFSELMTDSDFEMDQQLHFARMINASGNQLLSIISDIMDFSKIETGQVVVLRNRVSVNRIVNDVLQDFSYRLVDKEIELRADPANPVEEIVVESDEVKVRQILNNLVGNAIKFTRKGYIELGITVADDAICFRVKDTGIGIPEEFHESIFERFRQIEPALTRKYGGSGLGLAISKSLVQMLGGKIWIESQPGEGSTFFFTLPR